MKKLILLAGLPGSGKTTICRCMGEMTGIRYVDVDLYKKRRTDPTKVTEEVDSPKLRLLYCQDALEVAFGFFDDGASTVVMDEVYPYHSVRVKLEALCKEWDVQVLWVEVRSASGTAEKRLTSRQGHILLPLDKAVGIHRMCALVFEAFSAEISNHFVVNNEEDSNIDSLVASILERI